MKNNRKNRKRTLMIARRHAKVIDWYKRPTMKDIHIIDSIPYVATAFKYHSPLADLLRIDLHTIEFKAGEYPAVKGIGGDVITLEAIREMIKMIRDSQPVIMGHDTPGKTTLLR